MKTIFIVDDLIITNIKSNTPYRLTTIDGSPFEVEGDITDHGVEVVLSVDTENFKATDPEGTVVSITGNLTHMVSFDDDLTKLFSTRLIKRDDIYSLDTIEISKKEV